MQYLCIGCPKIFLAEDIPGALTPQKWKYCPECVKNGKPDIKEKPISKKMKEKMDLIRSKKGKDKTT